MRQLGGRRGLALACAVMTLAGCVSIGTDIFAEPPSTPSRPVLVTSRPMPTPPPATAAPSADPTRPPGDRPTDPPPDAEPTPTPRPRPRPGAGRTGACRDGAYEISHRWQGTYDWFFHSDSTPSDYESSEVLAVIERSAQNITNAFNDCGLPDNVNVEARYRGPTADVPCAGDTSSGVNVVGFGEMPARLGRGTIAYMCPYGNRSTGDIVEADIVVNRDVEWALSADDCRFEELLEATMTHEFGHVFGLGHVAERRHGDLTMSTRSNGLCTTDEISLGLGDILGLEELYAQP